MRNSVRAARRREALPERLAFDQLHDDVRGIIDDTQLEHRDQVGMIEGAGRSRLLLESFQPVGICREGRRQDFDGDVPVELGVAGAIDLAHAAGAELRDDLVGADPFADQFSAHFLSAFVQLSITVSEFAKRCRHRRRRGRRRIGPSRRCRADSPRPMNWRRLA